MANILIVDDQPDFEEIIKTKLESLGHTIEVARNSKEALEKSTEHVPDLILMDIDLAEEEMCGSDVAFSIHGNEKTKNVKIAFLSSLTEPWPAASGERGEVSREMGMEDFLDKGADLDQTVAKITEILARPSGEVGQKKSG